MSGTTVCICPDPNTRLAGCPAHSASYFTTTDAHQHLVTMNELLAENQRLREALENIATAGIPKRSVGEPFRAEGVGLRGEGQYVECVSPAQYARQVLEANPDAEGEHG